MAGKERKGWVCACDPVPTRGSRKVRGHYLKLSLSPPCSGRVRQAVAMEAVASLSEVEKKAVMDKGGSELKFLFDKEGGDELFQLKLYTDGITSVKTFAALFTDATDLRAGLKELFHLDPTKDFATRIKVSKIVVAWETAKTRGARDGWGR